MEILDRKRDVFQPGKQGIIFIGHEELGEKYFLIRCLSMIDCIISSYQIFCEDQYAELKGVSREMNGYYLRRKMLKILADQAREDDKNETVVCRAGFRACESSVVGFAPFYYNTELPMAPPPQSLCVFFQFIFDEVKHDKYLKNMTLPFERIRPFATTCAAKADVIEAEFAKLLEAAQKEIDECILIYGSHSIPHLYGFIVSIQNNSELDASKDRIESMIKATLGVSFPQIAYEPLLSEEASPESIGDKPTIMFHITVLGENAFLGYYMDPEKLSYYRFNYTADDLIEFYRKNGTLEEESEDCE